MHRYFVFSNDQVSKPLGLDELRQKIASGEITEQHRISIDGGDWVAAHEIQGLLPATEVETSEIKPPSPTPGIIAQPPPPSASQIGWFYAKDGQTIGPLPEDAFKGLARAGIIKAGDFVWSSGQPGAIPAIHVPILTEIFHGVATATPVSAFPHTAPSVQPPHTIPSIPHFGHQRPNSIALPVSKQGVVWTFWIASISGIASLIFIWRAQNAYPEEAQVAGLLVVSFAISSLLFIVFYGQALYRCWDKLHLAGDTRWPSPTWAVVIFIGTGLLTGIPSSLTQFINAVSMAFTHVWLGQRLKAILAQVTRAGEKPWRSKTTSLAHSLIAVSFVGGLWFLASTPENFDNRMLIVALVSMNMEYRFICSAVKDINWFHQQAVAPIDIRT